MKKLIKFSIQHPISVIMLTIAMLLCGIICCFSINIDYLPELSSRRIIISTKYKGIAPAEIEEMITIPVEEAFASLKGLKSMESVSRDSLSLISIELKWGTDIDMALVQCREIIDSLYPSMPSGCEKSEVFENTMKKDSVKIAVIPMDKDLSNAENICRTEIKPILQRLDGVSSVKITGGKKEQIEVLVNKDELGVRGLTLQEVSEIIATSNFEYPAGNIIEGENELFVKTDGLYKNLNEILQTPLQYNNGGILKVSSIANVKRSHKKQDSFFMLDGKECILLGIQKRNDASPLQVSKNVKKELEELKENFSSYLDFKIIEDRSDYLVSSLEQLCICAIISFAIAMLTVYLFLNSLRLSFMIAMIIPVCSIFSIIALKITGNSLNIMSLSGIAIGIGMVIDCSAVTLENIQEKNIQNQDKKQEQVFHAIQEISSSNTGSTITTALVFLPIFFMKGLAKELFTSMAISITAAICASWLLSFTLIPSIYMLISAKKIPVTRDAVFFAKIQAKYKKSLTWFFKNKKILLLICLAVLSLGYAALKNLKFKLLSELSSKSVEAELIFPTGFSVSALKQEAKKIYNSFTDTDSYNYKSFKTIKNISISGGIEQNDFSELCKPECIKEKLCVLIQFEENKKVDLNEITDFFAKNGYKATTKKTNDLLSEILSVKDKTFLYSASDRKSLKTASQKFNSEKEFINYRIIPDEYEKEFVFTPDRINSSRFSITAAYTASIIRNAIEGVESCNYYENGKEIPVVVKFHTDQVKNIADLENLTVKLEQKSIPMSLLGKFSIENKEQILYRNNRKPSKLIKSESSSFSDNDTTLQNAISKNTKLIDLQKIQLQELWGDSTILLCVVFLLLYLVLGAQFESFLTPLLLLLALPPAISGAFIFLAVTGKNLDINTLIALIVLFGTVVNNSIILYEKCIADIALKTEISSENILSENIIEDCVSRIKTLLLTNGTTICSLIPFTLDFSNTSSQASVAVTIIGGMIFSLAMTLFVIPIFLMKILKNNSPELPDEQLV